jgi:uncharacterized protein YpmS
MRLVISELECIIITMALKVAVHLVVVLAHMGHIEERASTGQITSSKSHVSTTNDQLTEIVETVVHVPSVVSWLSHTHR